MYTKFELDSIPVGMFIHSVYPPGTGLNKIVDEMDASLTNRAIHFLNALLIILFK